jgi:hypothetical protein
MCGVPTRRARERPDTWRVYLGWLEKPHVFCSECAKRESAAGFTARRRLLCLNSAAMFFVAECGICDDWEQASHNDLDHAVEAGVLTRNDVEQLGDVLIGTAEGRESERDITVYDSTGLAIQDLAIALTALERADELEVPQLEL